MKGDGHVRLFGTLTIGHRLHEGVQRVQCFPFADMKFYGSNRMDTVFIRPPNVSVCQMGRSGCLWIMYGSVGFYFCSRYR